jgi:hypothetical protein
MMFAIPRASLRSVLFGIADSRHLRVPRLDADNRRTCFGHAAVEPLQRNSGFKADPLHRHAHCAMQSSPSSLSIPVGGGPA